jgi:long-chain acyl-CoA synthetase
VALKDRFLYALGRWVVYEPLKNVLGFSRIRVAYTAGEAIGPELFTFYRSLGMNLKQLYGQTEAFLYLTAHRDGEIRADTVGPPMPNVDLKITEAGEVLFKSPGMFVGYFRDNERTAETLTPDGYVKTGDAGFFDTEGHLRIIDRAKDVGRLNDGTLFRAQIHRKQAKVLSQHPRGGRLRAPPRLRRRVHQYRPQRHRQLGGAQKHRLWQLPGARRPPRCLCDDREPRDRNQPRSRLRATDGRGQIHRFLILHKELDPDDGELTRTLKVRRGFIAERYGPLIEALYDGSTSQYIETEVTFEDGRKGMIHADVEIRDVKTYPVRQHKEAAE